MVSETVEVSPYLGHKEPLIYPFISPENVRNLKIQGTVKSVEGGTFCFTITNGEVYVKAEEVSEKSFEFLVKPEELSDGLYLEIHPSSK